MLVFKVSPSLLGYVETRRLSKISHIIIIILYSINCSYHTEAKMRRSKFRQ